MAGSREGRGGVGKVRSDSQNCGGIVPAEVIEPSGLSCFIETGPQPCQRGWAGD